MPTEPQDPVVEARELLRRASFEGYSVFPWKIVDTDVVDASGQVLLKIWNGYHNGELAAAAPELLSQLCDEVERLRRQVKQMAQDARDDAEGAATEARWQERQGEDYGSY